MKRKTLIYLIGLAIILPLLIAYAFSQDAERAKRIQLRKEFETAQKRALQILESHALIHKDCDLLKLLPTITFMSFAVGSDNRYFGAWVYVEHKIYDSEHDARVFVNINHPWDYYFQIIVVFHEAFHLTYDAESNKYICGPDRVKTYTPVCRILGKSMFTSEDITNAITQHLKPYENWNFDQ